VSPSALFVTTVPITLEAFLAPFARHFRSRGWRIDALANGATGNPRISDVFDNRFNVAWSRNPLDPRNLLGSAHAVRRIVTSGGYDIVHVHTPVAAFVTRFALRGLPRGERPVLIYTAHGFHFYEGQSRLPHAAFRGLERLASPWTDYLVTINTEDFEAARALGGIDPARVRLIPGIGVDTARFESGAVSATEATAVRESLDIAPGAFVLTVVAELAPVKRHALLLDALARVNDHRVVLLLVGDGPLEARLREHVSALGLGDRVRFAGYRRDIPAVLAASDAFAMVSEREGLNRSVLEAMASGKAVIGTQTRGIADAVGTDAGWIVPKNDIDGLTGAIEAAAADPTETAHRGVLGRARAVAEFGLDRIINDYEELYREALASRV